MRSQTVCALSVMGLVMTACNTSPLLPELSPSVTADEVFSPELQYFEEIALGAEYGNAQARVRKWVSPVHVQIHGSPTEEDRAALAAVIADLQRLVGASQIRLVEAAGNIDLWFAPSESFPAIEPNYTPGNLGFVWAYWNDAGVIFRARILVATDRTTPQHRAHLIREELTQALGLLQDSARFPQSIFFAGWSETTEYAAVDELLIRLLYRHELRPGASRSEALRTLSQLRING